MHKIFVFLFIWLPCLLSGSERISDVLATVKSSEWAPDFLIVGAQKAGTTILNSLIGQHPKILAKKKEIHFFDVNYYLGLDWYRSQLRDRPDSSYLIGDKSPYYLFHPHVPARVKAHYPKVKIIALLRNPIDRAYSQYWMNVRINCEPLSFEEAIEAEPLRLAGVEEQLKDLTFMGGNHRKYSYLARGVYVNQIKNWLKYFPRNQILIVSSNDLRNQPEQTLNTIYKFLGLPSYTVTVKNPEKHSHYPPMDSATRKKLALYFDPYNKELEKLWGVSFNWK